MRMTIICMTMVIGLVGGCRTTDSATSVRMADINNPAKAPPVKYGPSMLGSAVHPSVDTAVGTQLRLIRASAYYLNGPQDPAPPSGTLRRGTVVRVEEASGSYTVVRLADARKAHVATSDLQVIE